MNPTADQSDRPRIWACGISRLSDLFLDIAAEYNDRAELRVVTRGFEDIVREIDMAGPQRPDVVVAVSYTHLTLPTNTVTCRSRWSPYH